MAEYRLTISEEHIEDSRRYALEEIHGFIATMDGRPLAVVTLDEQQSVLWDEEGEIDYQDEFGRQIVSQVNSDGVTESLVIRNCEGLPVALASMSKDAGWQGIGIEKRLRFQIATMLQNDETVFE